MPRRAFFLAALLAAGLWLNLRSDAPPAPGSHDAAFTKDGLIKADVSQLRDTQIVANPDAQLNPANNVIWCGTLQLAWNEAIGLIGEKPRFFHQPPLVDLLNREDFTRRDLDPGSYVAIADFERNHVEAEIRAALEKVFHGAASPDLIPPVPPNPGPDDFVAYAYLFKNLAFARPFLNSDSIVFAGTPVKGFGFTGKPSDLRDQLAAQVTICSYNSADDFVIKLKTSQPGDELILAKVPPLAMKIPPGLNLLPTLITADSRATAYAGAVGPGDVLAIPKINIDLEKEFTELEGLKLNPGPAAKIQSQLTLTRAQQLVRFQLNEKGAVLKSEATLGFAATAMIAPQHRLIFDKPFLILMKQAGSAKPYFAMWVGNASLLIPAK
jgi:hypothetical protein